MEEEKQEKQEKEEPKTMVDKANDAAERLEKANERTAELIKQREEIDARNRLGGRADGAVQDEKPKEVSDEDYADKALRGELNEQGKWA